MDGPGVAWWECAASINGREPARRTSGAMRGMVFAGNRGRGRSRGLFVTRARRGRGGRGRNSRSATCCALRLLHGGGGGFRIESTRVSSGSISRERQRDRGHKRERTREEQVCEFHGDLGVGFARSNGAYRYYRLRAPNPRADFAQCFAGVLIATRHPAGRRLAAPTAPCSHTTYRAAPDGGGGLNRERVGPAVPRRRHGQIQ